MAEEIQEAVQIIRVAYDGIEIAMKVGSGGIAAMQKAIDFLKGMCCSFCQLLQFKYSKSSSHCIRYLCDGYCHVLHQSEKLYAWQRIWYGKI